MLTVGADKQFLVEFSAFTPPWVRAGPLKKGLLPPIENLGLNKCQNCFANISATKARIFMKFYVVVKYYLVSLSFQFHEDLCINARA